MALTDVVTVNVSLSNPGVTTQGFGVALIGTPNATWPERTRSYQQIADVAVDWPTTSPEYLAANAMFEQNPRLQSLMIGRLANKPTQVLVLGVAQVIEGLTYAANLFYTGVTQKASYAASVLGAAWQATHAYVTGNLVVNDSGPVKVYKCITSGTSAGSGGPTGTAADITDGTAHWKYMGASVGGTANDVIVDGLVAAINALAAPALGATAAATGVAGAEVVTITANAAGNWLALEAIDLNLLSVLETEADPGIVADLTAIALESTDWYGLVLLFKSPAIILAAAGWVESNVKLMLASSADSIIATTADSGATDVMHALKLAARARTAPSYHPRNYEFFDCAQMGRWFGINPGKDNWTHKSLSGVTPASTPTSTNFTPTYKNNLEAKNCNYYYLLGGKPVVGGVGVVAAHEYIDVVRGIDWWTARVSERCANRFIDEEKIPFDDDGILILENEVRAQNDEGIDAGLIAPTPRPTVTAPLVANVSSSDKAARQLNGLNTKWTLAGAINHLTVNAAITQ